MTDPIMLRMEPQVVAGMRTFGTTLPTVKEGGIFMTLNDDEWEAMGKPVAFHVQPVHEEIFTDFGMAPPEMSEPPTEAELDDFFEALDDEPLTFGHLAIQNKERAERWHGGPFTQDSLDQDDLLEVRMHWTGADWSNAMVGEAGEAANVVKKMRRIETGIVAEGEQSKHQYEDLRNQLGWELADTVAYADLLAQYYGIDLGRAVREKFNHVRA